MKNLILLFCLFTANNAFSQQTNKTVNIGSAQTVNVKQGNVIIGKLLITEDANRAKIYLDTLRQFKDTFNIWHTIVTFTSLDPNPMFSSYIQFEFDESVINIQTKFPGMITGGLNASKKIYTCLSTNMTVKPFSFYINSEKKVTLKMYGVLGKVIH